MELYVSGSEIPINKKENHCFFLARSTLKQIGELYQVKWLMKFHFVSCIHVCVCVCVCQRDTNSLMKHVEICSLVIIIPKIISLIRFRINEYP